MKGKAEKREGKRGITWQFTVELPRDPLTGKRRQKLLTARTKREVEDLAGQLYGSIANGGLAGADVKKTTISQYLTRWLASMAQSVRPSTHARYADMVRMHVVPLIGNIQLGKLSPLDIQQVYAAGLGNGLSTTTVRMLHGILHKALRQAVRWGLLTRNVTEMVDVPRKATREYVTWNQKQVAAFLAVSDTHEWAAFWRLALITGARRGELLGIKWHDLDLQQGKLTFQRTLIRAEDGKLIFGSQKTASSKRTVDLPQSVVERLQTHRKQQIAARLAMGSAYNSTLDLVFANAIGEPIHPNSLIGQFKRLTAKADVPAIRFHDMRHTVATLLMGQGVSPKVVQQILGHSDVAMTLRIYSHVSPQMQRAATEQLDKLIDNAS